MVNEIGKQEVEKDLLEWIGKTIAEATENASEWRKK